MTSIAKKTSKNLTSISVHCSNCKGSCWHGDDQSATQKAALAKFGVIPNTCLNDENGRIHCPAVLGML